jgi:hypothetical protein
MVLLIRELVARKGWVVSTRPGRFTPLERPSTHCTQGWVGPRAGLDVCKKSRPPPGIFFFSTIVDRFDLLVVRVTNMGQIILLPLPKEGML